MNGRPSNQQKPENRTAYYIIFQYETRFAYIKHELTSKFTSNYQWTMKTRLLSYAYYYDVYCVVYCVICSGFRIFNKYGLKSSLNCLYILCKILKNNNKFKFIFGRVQSLIFYTLTQYTCVGSITIKNNKHNDDDE